MKNVLLACLAVVVLGACANTVKIEPALLPDSPEAIVQRQVDAYNRRDLDAFVATYAANAEAFTFPNTPLGTGHDAWRAIYGPLFRDTPDLNVVISRRIVHGATVIDEEQLTMNGKLLKVVAIYQIESGKIRRVWFIE